MTIVQTHISVQNLNVFIRGKHILKNINLDIPDKKITVPYAIDELVSILRDRSDYVSAAGYVVRFGMQDADVDLYRVSMFAPSIVDEEPLRRLYAFVRRYVVSVLYLIWHKCFL